MQLPSHRDELVIAESVVVIKKLTLPAQHEEIIKHLAKAHRQHPGARGPSQYPMAPQRALTSNEYRFTESMLTSRRLVLLTLDSLTSGASQLTVSSEKMVITMLVKDTVQGLTQ
ncbi:hypothetical protein HPG69_000245 [Diceros bicornis minor]|uniref:AP-3 complex subunit beta-1/2 C-terminal domain-containing protein n=1 Tax=Diceros bicornis minor TaxID=77932 RepID=A0A7J7EVM8_DICBM|nr:hypothetical protein HPG69_000245 [Diceros bicornis minor]